MQGQGLSKKRVAEQNLQPNKRARTEKEQAILSMLPYIENKKAALFKAIKEKNLDLVRLIIDEKLVDKNVLFDMYGEDEEEDEYQVTPLMAAVLSREESIVTYLLDSGVELNMVEPIEGNTAFLFALGNLDIIQLLYDKGANIEQKDIYGCTALHYAARNNCIESAQLLIKLGANVEDTNNDGYTPLKEAIDHHNFDMVKILIHAKAKADDIDPPIYLTRQHDTLNMLHTLGLENLKSEDENRINPNVLRDDLREALISDRKDMLINNATYHVVAGLLNHEKTKRVAEILLNTIQADDLDLTKPNEKNEEQLSINQTFITGMNIFKDLAPELRSQVIHHLGRGPLTYTPREDQKAREIAEVTLTSRFKLG